MNKLKYLQELRDILKNSYDNGGLDSVNFVTQGGAFYFEKEEDFLEVLEDLEYYTSKKGLPYLVSPSDCIIYNNQGHDVLSLTWGSNSHIYARLHNHMDSSKETIDLHQVDFKL